jgi:hypothetical protein
MMLPVCSELFTRQKGIVKMKKFYFRVSNIDLLIWLVIWLIISMGVLFFSDYDVLGKAFFTVSWIPGLFLVMFGKKEEEKKINN